MLDHRPVSKLLCLGAVALVASGLPSVAKACTPRPSGMISSRTVVPADGAVAVPTNARPMLTYDGCALQGLPDNPRLRVAGAAEAVEADLSSSSAGGCATLLTIAPKAPLLADTRYEIVSDLGEVPCRQTESSPPLDTPVCGTGAEGTGSVVVATFSTGAGLDVTPPVLGGTLSYIATPRECTSVGCCGPQSGFDIALSWGAVTGETSPVSYQLRREAEVVLGGIQTPAVSGLAICSGAGFVQAGFLAEPGPYSIVAVDIAGNASAPLSTDIGWHCPQQPEEPTDDGGSSCRIAGTGAGRSPGMLATTLLVLTLVWLRRRSFTQ